ncbi:MAG: hypothetical protein A2Y66_07350 [Nitrospirae bacterium RBG_13_41_22]|nr:MAG: hypothetical protein A2Y66_07350 [Nitrospirae bacterium RBG_13_41_22]
MRVFFRIKIICFIAIFSLTTPLLAIMKGLGIEELTRASEAVIIGDVVSAEAQWSKDGKIIFTSVSIVISDVIKGKVPKRQIIVEYEGGEIGDIGLRVSDVPHLIKGEKVILFLKSGKSRKDGVAYNMVGKAQGKYMIDENGIARKGGFTTVDSKEVVDNNIPTEVLIDRIRRVEQ